MLRKEAGADLGGWGTFFHFPSFRDSIPHRLVLSFEAQYIRVLRESVFYGKALLTSFLQIPELCVFGGFGKSFFRIDPSRENPKFNYE